MIVEKKLAKKLKILKFGDPVLRQAAKPVTVFHSKLQLLVDSMKVTLHSRDDGAALAAPQLGILKRIVVIDYQDEYLELINPEILLSKGKKVDFEGCLSLPGYFGKVPRAEYVKLKYFDRFGKENIIERKGPMARCIQHELDHLDGILFVDRMEEDHLQHNDNETKISLQSVIDLANGNLKNSPSQA